MNNLVIRAKRPASDNCDYTELTHAEWQSQKTKPWWPCHCHSTGCDTHYMLRWGDVYNAHLALVNASGSETGSGCGGMTVDHRTAQCNLHAFLREGSTIKVSHTCKCCQTTRLVSSVQLKSGQCARMEHKFQHNETTRWADIAIVEGDRMSYIIEVKHTSKTSDSNRPTDIEWVEVLATDVIQQRKRGANVMELSCNRIRECKVCIQREAERVERIKAADAERVAGVAKLARIAEAKRIAAVAEAADVKRVAEAATMAAEVKFAKQREADARKRLAPKKARLQVAINRRDAIEFARRDRLSYQHQLRLNAYLRNAHESVWLPWLRNGTMHLLRLSDCECLKCSPIHTKTWRGLNMITLTIP